MLLVIVYVCPCTSVFARASVSFKPEEGRHFVSKGLFTVLLLGLWLEMDLVRFEIRTCRMDNINKDLYYVGMR